MSYKFRGRLKSIKVDDNDTKKVCKFWYLNTVKDMNEGEEEYGVAMNQEKEGDNKKDNKKDNEGILLKSDEKFEVSDNLYRFLCSCRDEELMIEFDNNIKKITKITVIY